MKFETLAVHAASDPEPGAADIAPAIHLSTNFVHGPDGTPTGDHLYIRKSSPTQTRLEAALAALEGGEAALAFSSGSGAGSAYLQSVAAGSHVLFHDRIYHAFKVMASEYLPRWGIETSFADLTDLASARTTLRENTRLLWVESPTNPEIQVLDIAALATLAHENSARLLVDGTFATPAIQRPLALGADVVLHATTKYLAGHGDVLGGALVFARSDETVEQVAQNRYILGPAPSPFASWLVLRGLRTLACRMERHAASALAVARALEAHPRVAAVHYPGLASHPGHAIAKRQMSAFGGMLSIRVKGGKEAALRTASRVRLFRNATSLGGVESLIEHRASIEGPDTTTSPDLLRLSIGLEHPDDLIADLTNALEG